MVLVWMSIEGFWIRHIVLILAMFSHFWHFWICSYVLSIYLYSYSVVRLNRAPIVCFEPQREMNKMNEWPKVWIEKQKNWLNIVTDEWQNVICISWIQNTTAHGIHILILFLFLEGVNMALIMNILIDWVVWFFSISSCSMLTVSCLSKIQNYENWF